MYSNSPRCHIYNTYLACQQLFITLSTRFKPPFPSPMLDHFNNLATLDCKSRQGLYFFPVATLERGATSTSRHRFIIHISIVMPGPKLVAMTLSRPRPIFLSLSKTISTVGLDEFPYDRYVSREARMWSSVKFSVFCAPCNIAAPPG
jgi:hypothetical protein